MARALLLLSLFVSSFAFGGDETAPLRVGVTVEYEPVSFQVAGELQGIEIDFANLLGKKLDREVTFTIYRLAELIDALEAGEIDLIMAGMSVTEERAARVTFTDPYMVIGQMGIVRAEDAATFSGPDALARDGIKVGVHLGSTGEQYVIDNLPHANLIAYGSVEESLAALRDSEIDVMIHDSTTSRQLHRSFVNDQLLSLNRFLTRESVAWATRDSDKELRTLINFALKDMKEEGLVREVIDRWLPMIPVSI